jgi:hypothetical protein
MTSRWIRLAIFGLFLLTPRAVTAQTAGELDAFWAELARTVEEGDFEGYSALYHPDAILVSLGSETSYPIAQALAGWKQGFDDTRAGDARAGVDFRFTRRLHDETTAHETGIFRYTFQPQGEAESVAMLHFEGLLVRNDEGWLLIMEFQQEAATDAEWEAAR